MTKVSGKEIVALKNRVCSLFTHDDWLDIAYITGSEELVKGHYRLLQSLHFRDDDYERSALEVLKSIADQDKNNIQEIRDFIESKYPDNIELKSPLTTGLPKLPPAPQLPNPPTYPKISLMSPAKNQFEVSQQKDMDIFISHSSQDANVAKLLIDLIRAAFNMSARRIRCTSVDGYRLPAGASTDEQLKKEVHDAKVMVALISASSMDSTYVLFELGARWATSLPFVPLVTNNLGTQLLKGPLGGINALNISSTAQVHQLISDLSSFLKLESESPAVYQDKIEVLVETLLNGVLPIEAEKIRSVSSVSDIDSIKSYCESQWPEDFSMRIHCVKVQKEAAANMKEPKPSDIPNTVFQNIIDKAVREWPDDYTMQVHSRDEQIAAYRELQSM
ncbi:TIR domain-containing protein [Hymenobacter chitinivorans]|uniref:TIR domain-containing protein n=1 Tax=Hymenobacter chitinivorans DSM 11115 TaxID=1121954 RepID=A0A2M9BAT9_9BACT|nr:TIR domain-containing protein [Hymenobacter chitinivorans]PJJ55047.1 TIR domain-containing protein [Hymenobacter chitinivorans DSM 11115]